MSKYVICCALLVAFSLSINVVLAGMEYPQEMMEVSSPYPGATIAQTVNASGTVMVTMESNDNPDQIFEFYKNELLVNRWTITNEIQTQGTSGLMSEKGSKNVIVNIGSGHSGKSIISLMLTQN
ncbi:MAG: hypothetical protein KJO26_10025 [Deltaproteobacteria bacterium]|nr:hypothetical protein [Deltaproteobacteria bacterium]NNK84067.1 hypothetical protein [Desulfobacterales bacterium]